MQWLWINIMAKFDNIKENQGSVIKCYKANHHWMLELKTDIQRIKLYADEKVKGSSSFKILSSLFFSKDVLNLMMLLLWANNLSRGKN